MSQAGSPFFRLPRELRDEVYRYVVLEPAGYVHNATSKRMRTSNNTLIDLSLSYTCKQINAEMHGVALKTNRIIFATQLDLSATTKDPFITRRFNDLQGRYYRAITSMLSWASECVTPGILDTLLSLHPYNNDIRLLQSLDENQRLHQLRGCGLVKDPGAERSIGTLRALRDLVKLISSHPSFHALTAKEYDSVSRNGEVPPYRAYFYEDGSLQYDDRKHAPRYAPGSQEQLLERIIEPWWILDEAEFARLDSPLPRYHSYSWPMGAGYEHPVRKAYFSATACAIKFLRQLSASTRKHIRKIQIEEDHLCDSKQPSHAHGLIPFCIENPKLRVDTRVDMWSVVLWDCWLDDEYGQTILVDELLSRMSSFFREALLLPNMGMPTGQYHMTFQGKTPEMTQQLWKCIKRAAALQEAAENLYQHLPNEEQHCLLQMPISPDFPRLVKEILGGNTPIQADACVGGAWELEQAVHDLEHNVPDPGDWESIFDMSDLESQTQVWEALRKEYFVTAD